MRLFPETSPPRHLRPARAVLLAAGPGAPPHGLHGRAGRARQHQDLRVKLPQHDRHILRLQLEPVIRQMKLPESSITTSSLR